MGFWKKVLLSHQRRHTGNLTGLERSLQATSKHFRNALANCWWEEERETLLNHWELEMERIMVDFSKILKGRGIKGSNVPLDDDAFAKAWPTLHAFCADTIDQDGKTRITSTITLFFEDGVVKGMLKERNANLLLWVTAPTLLDVFGCLEIALTKDTVDWRQAVEGGGTRRSPR